MKSVRMICIRRVLTLSYLPILTNKTLFSSVIIIKSMKTFIMFLTSLEDKIQLNKLVSIEKWFVRDNRRSIQGVLWNRKEQTINSVR